MNGQLTITKKIFYVIMAAIVGCSFMSGCSKVELNDIEDTAKYSVLAYKRMMKDPDSFTLKSDICCAWAETDNKKVDIYVFFKCAGKNSFGSMTTSYPIMKNDKYYFNFDDVERYGNEIKEKCDESGNRSEYLNFLDLTLMVHTCKLVMSTNSLTGSEMYGDIEKKYIKGSFKRAYVISGEKMSKAVGCKYEPIY